MAVHDVAVIGGGLVGTAASFYLARAGARTVVIECGQINGGASGRNAGSLHFQLEPRMAERLRTASAQLAQLLPVSLQAIQDWQELGAVLESELEVGMHGGLIVAESQSDCVLLEHKLGIENRLGLGSRLLAGSELRRLAPYLSEKVLAASYCEFEGHANPRLVTPAFARAGLRCGAVYRVGTAVRSIRRESGRWRLALTATDSAAEGELLEARTLLVAAGAWSAPIMRMLGVELPLRPLALTMSVTERTTPMVRHLVQHMGRRLSLKQADAGNLIVGGAWPARLRCNGLLPDETGTDLWADAIIGNLQVARDVVPAMANLHLLRSWSGIAADTPDHLPLLGMLPGLADVYVAAGGSSFTLGPTFARLIAEVMLTGKTTMDIGMYAPARFLAA